jgi:1-acyl-sn-glycerol-3-phosphate acyltransferase
VTLTLLPAAWLVLVASLPVALVVAAVVDLVRPRRLAVLRSLSFLIAYLTLECVGVVASFWLWLAWLGHRDRRRFLDANFRLQCGWASAMRRAAFALFSVQLEVQGAEHAAEGPMIVFMRHASVADTMLPTMLISVPHGVALRWVLKRELLWDPCLDIVGNRLRNCFVARGGQDRDGDIEAVISLLDDLDVRSGVAIYPEGTRFTEATRERVLAKLKGTAPHAFERAAKLRRVLPPRPGGPLALLLHEPASDVVFLAHRGFESARSLGDLFSGRVVGATVQVKLWRVRAAAVPRDPAAASAWLDEQWAEVDRFVVDG